MDPEEQNTIMKETCQKLIDVNKITEIKQSELDVDKSNKNIVGYGGQAIVYRGKYKNQEVAIKELTNIDWKSLCNELVILGNLESKNIPKFFGIVIENNIIELVFEYIDGKTLDDFPKNYFKEEEKIRIAKDICGVLYEVHLNKFIHRDIKLENIIIDKDGKSYLIDFGIAKVLADAKEAYTRAKGTIYYVAPEVFDGDDEDEEGNILSCITEKVDIWAFGCILSYLFSGYMPWTPKNKDNEAIITQCIFLKEAFPIPNNITNEKIKDIIRIATIVNKKQRADITKIKDLIDKL